jgi:hypothetical protein
MRLAWFKAAEIEVSGGILFAFGHSVDYIAQFHCEALSIALLTSAAIAAAVA